MNRADGSIFNSDGLRMEIDYDVRTDGQPLYQGYAAMGQATTDKRWQINKFTYTTITGNDYVSSKKIAIGAWDDRANLTYS